MPSKQTRPNSDPIPVRFSEDQVKIINEVAENLGMSRADVIRLSVAAGIKILHRLGHDGLATLIADQEQ